jgi:hypothetical protein
MISSNELPEQFDRDATVSLEAAESLCLALTSGAIWLTDEHGVDVVLAAGDEYRCAAGSKVVLQAMAKSVLRRCRLPARKESRRSLTHALFAWPSLQLGQ